MKGRVSCCMKDFGCSEAFRLQTGGWDWTFFNLQSGAPPSLSSPSSLFSAPSLLSFLLFLTLETLPFSFSPASTGILLNLCVLSVFFRLVQKAQNPSGQSPHLQKHGFLFRGANSAQLLSFNNLKLYNEMQFVVPLCFYKQQKLAYTNGLVIQKGKEIPFFTFNCRVKKFHSLRLGTETW